MSLPPIETASPPETPTPIKSHRLLLVHLSANLQFSQVFSLGRVDLGDHNIDGDEIDHIFTFGEKEYPVEAEFVFMDNKLYMLACCGAQYCSPHDCLSKDIYMYDFSSPNGSLVKLNSQLQAGKWRPRKFAIDGKIYIIASTFDPSDRNINKSPRFEVFDPRTDSTTELPEPRFAHIPFEDDEEDDLYCILNCVVHGSEIIIQTEGFGLYLFNVEHPNRGWQQCDSGASRGDYLPLTKAVEAMFVDGLWYKLTCRLNRVCIGVYDDKSGPFKYFDQIFSVGMRYELFRRWRSYQLVHLGGDKFCIVSTGGGKHETSSHCVFDVFQVRKKTSPNTKIEAELCHSITRKAHIYRGIYSYSFHMFEATTEGGVGGVVQ